MSIARMITTLVLSFFSGVGIMALLILWGLFRQLKYIKQLENEDAER